jgi:hypothetical protein
MLVRVRGTLSGSAPPGAFAQESQELAATFNERFPADQTSTQPFSRDPGGQEGTERYGDHARRHGLKRPRPRLSFVMTTRIPL